VAVASGAAPTITAVEGVQLVWGESVRWDDRRDRLYFVDCGTQTLHWLDHGQLPLRSMEMPSVPTGVVLADDGRLVVALDGGLHVVDPDADARDGSIELLASYPEGLGGRANDANADLDGNLVTGTLNLGAGTGSYWWYSSSAGWRQLDDGIGNANGPVVVDGTLVFGDTPAGIVHAYDYDGTNGTATGKRTFADTKPRNGLPDGACADAGGGVWSCLLGAGTIVRFTGGGATDVVETGVELPSDVTFGGPDLATMFVVSIAVSVGGVDVRSPDAGKLLAIDGTGHRGRPEPRFRLPD
jgi:sugar lactone lactonase YvrE